jgi:hypothetical protein
MQKDDAVAEGARLGKAQLDPVGRVEEGPAPPNDDRMYVE